MLFVAFQELSSKFSFEFFCFLKKIEFIYMHRLLVDQCISN